MLTNLVEYVKIIVMGEYIKKGKFTVKKKTTFRALCTALCAAVVLSLTGEFAHADYKDEVSEKQHQLAAIREENEKRQQEIDALGGDISDNESAMKLIESQIDGYLSEIEAYRELVLAKQSAVEKKKSEIEEVEQTISEKELEIENKKAEIAELDSQNNANLEQFGKLMRYMYMNDMSSQLPLLNGSDDWYDYFVFSDVVKNISKQNADFMDEILSSIEKHTAMITELNGEIAALETEKQELQNEREALEQQEADLVSAKEALEADTEAKRSELYALAAQNDDFMAKISGLKTSIAEAEEQAEALNAEIEELIRQAQANRDPEMPDYSGDGLRWPLDPEHHTITCPFTDYDAFHNGRHTGIDISDGNIRGVPIRAAQSGTVITVSHTCTHNEPKPSENWPAGTCWCGGNYGNYIIIDHGGQLATLYGHCQDIYVSQGEHVEKGQAIGEVGSTGWSSWWHLHFETRVNGVRVNPMNYVS